MKKFNAVLFVLILGLFLGATAGNLRALAKEPVAIVNGVAITKTEFYELLERRYGTHALSELIQKQLVQQKADSLSLAISDAEFNELYAQILAQVGGPQGLQMFLFQNNLSEEQFKEQLRWNQLIAELAKSEVEVNEEAVTQWFLDHRADYDQKEAVDVSHILVDSEEEANNILAALQDGADFAALALEESTDPSAVENQGRLGRIDQGVTVPEFEEKAFSLGEGEYGSVESAYGWHIILVHERFAAQEAILSEIYGQVESDYQLAHSLDLQPYLQKLEAEAQIEILLPY